MHSRRTFLQGLGGLALAPAARASRDAALLRRAIPSSGETVPAVGLGSWITFDVQDATGRAGAFAVIDAFLRGGGGMIDSSPMYGFAQEVIGDGLRRSAMGQQAFSATKVWVRGRRWGEGQMEQALKLWGVQRLDLVHVHNMLDWTVHLPWLQAWREAGRIRYLGITTSHGRRHEEMERVIREQPFDFVQFTYNIDDREAEHRLLPLAAEHGRAVVINRPFQGGQLFRRVAGRPLPPWSTGAGMASWAEFFLSYILSHPAVTCAIPATTRVDHLVENLGALQRPLPDAGLRREMRDWFDRVAG